MYGRWTFICVMLDYSTYFQFQGDIKYGLDLLGFGICDYVMYILVEFPVFSALAIVARAVLRYEGKICMLPACESYLQSHVVYSRTESVVSASATSRSWPRHPRASSSLGSTSLPVRYLLAVHPSKFLYIFLTLQSPPSSSPLIPSPQVVPPIPSPHPQTPHISP
jgi:hypothetical protein